MTNEPSRKLSVTLIDDLGNVQELNPEEALEHLLSNKPLQDFYIPCDGCGRIVLHKYINYVKGKDGFLKQILCSECA